MKSVTLQLSEDMIAQIDIVAAKSDRDRSKAIRHLIGQSLQLKPRKAEYTYSPSQQDGINLPPKKILLEHVQPSIRPGFLNFFIGYSDVQHRWMEVHSAQLEFLP